MKHRSLLHVSLLSLQDGVPPPQEKKSPAGYIQKIRGEKVSCRIYTEDQRSKRVLWNMTDRAHIAAVWNTLFDYLPCIKCMPSCLKVSTETAEVKFRAEVNTDWIKYNYRLKHIALLQVFKLLIKIKNLYFKLILNLLCTKSPTTSPEQPAYSVMERPQKLAEEVKEP